MHSARIAATKEVNVQRWIPVLLDCLAGFFFSFPIISSPRDVNFGPGASNPRIKSPRKAMVLAPLLAGLSLGVFATHAQDKSRTLGAVNTVL